MSAADDIIPVTIDGYFPPSGLVSLFLRTSQSGTTTHDHVTALF
ncbi:hypothetical protein SAMN04487818_11176 [Actinokineospora terrae]|uniref:Uncharacterized protein n=1 Tax=Actinokineospora terrae TaxID=155974 RepID=A0A1H9WQ38_9PSEU|nr:hypothetical protein SAMN04487818_11176 [Actinokineospora terrae]